MKNKWLFGLLFVMFSVTSWDVASGFLGEENTNEQTEDADSGQLDEEADTGEPDFVDGDDVSWEQALEILYSGQVVAIYQLHNLEVTFELEDGSFVYTLEPIIDAIFHEKDNCGSVCNDIIMATE